MPAWGRIRATADADFLLHAAAAERDAVTDGFRKHGFAHMEHADRQKIGDQWVLHFWFPVRPHDISVRVDLIVAETPEYAGIVERAVNRRIDGVTVRVASCEDLILLKLVAGRAIDLADAKELLAINRDALDDKYLKDQAGRMGATDALAGLERDSA